MKDENKLKGATGFNQGAHSLDQYMLEQAEVNNYNQLIKVINNQLYDLLNPVATYYSEYDPETRTTQMKEIKAEPSQVDSALKIGVKKFSPTIVLVNDDMYGKLNTKSKAIYSTLTDIVCGGISKPVSESILIISIVRKALHYSYFGGSCVMMEGDTI